MHEIGHTLGLLHGGEDSIKYKPNHYSVMNYLWTLPIVPESDLPSEAKEALSGMEEYWRLSFSNGSRNDLDEHGLSEADGIGGDDAATVVIGSNRSIQLLGPDKSAASQPSFVVPVKMGPSEAVDWDRDEEIGSLLVESQVDQYPWNLGTPLQVLRDADDWALVRFYRPHGDAELLASGGAGALNAAQEAIPECITQTAYERLTTMRFDCNTNGIPDDEEIVGGTLADSNGNGIADLCDPERGNPLSTGRDAKSDPLLGLWASPNPFIGTCALRLYAARTGHFRIEVHSVSGARVETLLDEVVPSGFHEVTWDGTDGNGTRVASGIYFLRLRGLGEEVVRKVVMVR